MGRDITQLHPRLQPKVTELQKLCENQGLNIGISECFRTVAEQNLLYASGRTLPGEIVTNARGSSYSSMHQWGIAFDFFRNDGSGAYNDSDGFFTKVGSLGQSIGLEWGGDWQTFVDKSHFQLPDWGSTPTNLKIIYRTPAEFMETWEYETIETIIVEGKGSGYMFEPETVRRGSQGVSVLLLQEILKARGFRGIDGKELDLDRKCGINTEYAINAFQNARRNSGTELGTNGKNDGICGKKMWADIIGL